MFLFTKMFLFKIRVLVLTIPPFAPKPPLLFTNPFQQAMSDEPESKNAMKKRLKIEEAAKKKAAKEADKAAKAAAAPAKEKKFVAGAEDADLDPTQYYENRQSAVNKMLTEGADRNPYPHKFNVTHRLPDFEAEFGGATTDGERLTTVVSSAKRS